MQETMSGTTTTWRAHPRSESTQCHAKYLCPTCLLSHARYLLQCSQCYTVVLFLRLLSPTDILQSHTEAGYICHQAGPAGPSSWSMSLTHIRICFPQTGKFRSPWYARLTDGQQPVSYIPGLFFMNHEVLHGVSHRTQDI